MASSGNNIRGDIAHIRDSYFDSGEKEYLEELLQDPEEMEIHEELMKRDARELCEAAERIMQAVEEGRFDEKQMIKAERKITHLLAAIKDLEMVLESELTM